MRLTMMLAMVFPLATIVASEVESPRFRLALTQILESDEEGAQREGLALLAGTERRLRSS